MHQFVVNEDNELLHAILLCLKTTMNYYWCSLYALRTYLKVSCNFFGWGMKGQLRCCGITKGHWVCNYSRCWLWLMVCLRPMWLLSDIQLNQLRGLVHHSLPPTFTSLLPPTCPLYKNYSGFNNSNWHLLNSRMCSFP